MAHGEQIRGVSHQRIHVEYREGDAGQGSPQRSDHGYDTDDDCHGRKQGEDEQRSLDDSERRLIMLRYMQDKTQKQVAEVLGRNQVAISRMEKNTLEKLRRAMM